MEETIDNSSNYITVSPEFPKGQFGKKVMQLTKLSIMETALAEKWIVTPL